MPAKSKQQQKFFGVVKSMQKGDIPNKGEAGDVADDMDKKEVDKMTSTKHKGLPRKIKEMVLQELVKELKLNEVKPFVDPKMNSKPTDQVQYIATNDHRYPSEIAFFDTKKNEVVFFNIQQKEVERVSMERLSSTHWVRDYLPVTNEANITWTTLHKDNEKERKKNATLRTSSISKQRAKAELKDQLKGTRSDGMGKYTAIVYGMDGNDRVALTSMDDINKYSKFEIGDNEDALKEAKDVKSLKADYEKAISLEQQLSSLMLSNLVKYKQAKASGDETAIAKFTKIAGQLSPKKKSATDAANIAYQAYEDEISGLHVDAELQIDEGLARGLKPLLMIGSTLKSNVGENALLDLSDKFDELDDEQADDVASHLNMAIELMQDRSPSEARAWLKKFNKACKDALSGKSIKSAFENVNEVDMEDDTEFTVSLKHLTKKHVTKGGKIAEAEEYKYKKYVTKAFNNISDAIFEFRNAMGVKQLGQADPKVKKQLEALQVAIFSLRREFVSKGLSEAAQMGKGKLNEMDINDPILIAIRARQTMLKKAAGAPKVKKLSLDQYWKKLEYRSYIETQMKAAAKELEQLDSDMNAEAGQKGADWSDADANRYGGDLDKLQTKVEKLAKLKVKVDKSIMDYRTS